MAEDFKPEHTSRSTYKYWYTDKVRFSDLDHLEHAGSIRINEYFGGVRTQLFKEVIPDWPRSSIIPVLKTSFVQYNEEINYPTNLDVGLLIEKFGRTSMASVMAVFCGDKCMTLCRNVFVFINNTTRLPVVPDEVIKLKLERASNNTYGEVRS